MGILSVVFWAPSISAQTPDEWEWSRKLATSQNEFASSIAVDRLNNAVYTAGQADKAFSGVLGGPWAVMYGSNTGSDGYLVKHSLDGTLQWQIVVGAGGNDGITGVCTDMLGRVYVTGYFSATNASFTGAAGSSQTMSSTGGEDIFVACYNANGALQWNIRAGGAGNDRGNGICYANGKIFVGGSYSGSAVIAGMATTSTSAGNANTSHAFLTALQASDGSGEWLADSFNGENSTFNAVATDGTQDGAFIGTGVRALNVGVALTDCGVDAPSMDVVPRRFTTIQESGTGGAIFDWAVGPDTVERLAAEHPVVRPQFAAGDALLFDDLFLHRTAVGPDLVRPRFAIESWFFGATGYPEGQVPLVW